MGALCRTVQSTLDGTFECIPAGPQGQQVFNCELEMLPGELGRLPDPPINLDIC